MNLMYYMFAFLGFLVVGRILNERELKRLSAEEKSKLVDLFAKYRVYSILIAVAIIGFSFSLDRFELGPINSFVVMITMIAAWIIVFSVISYSILKKNGFPKRYCYWILTNSAIQLVAISILFGGIWLDAVYRIN